MAKRLKPAFRSGVPKSLVLNPQASRVVVDAGEFNAVIWVDPYRGIIVRADRPMSVTPYVANEVIIEPARTRVK